MGSTEEWLHELNSKECSLFMAFSNANISADACKANWPGNEAASKASSLEYGVHL